MRLMRFLSLVAICLLLTNACSRTEVVSGNRESPVNSENQQVPRSGSESDQKTVADTASETEVEAESSVTSPTSVSVDNASSASSSDMDSNSDQSIADLNKKKAAIQFVRDISNDDAEVVTRVNAAFENPVRDPSIVGFYFDESASDFEIAFKTAITALNDSDFVRTFENRYVNELPSLILKDESIFPSGAEVNQQISLYVEQLAYGMELGPDDIELDEPIFAEAVEKIETTANENGVYFLELNLGSSDVRFIIPTDQINYERWLNVAFDSELTVERLTWATVWDDIAYNIYDTDTYNLPGILIYEKPVYRNARDLVSY